MAGGVGLEKEKSFVKAGAVLVVSGFAVKVLSAVYRIPLTRMLGANLMGKYSSVFSLFMPFMAFATAGVAPCVSRFTARISDGDTHEIDTLRSKAMKLYLAIAVAMAVIFILFGRIYSAFQQDSIFFAGAVILAPSIVFASAEAVCKGITQGIMDMSATAKANIMESGIKTVLGLGSVYFIKKYMEKYPANLPVEACLMSVTLSGAVCAAYLWKSTKIKENSFIKNRKNTSKGEKTATAAQLMAMSVPVSASALVASMVSFFDTAVCLPVIKQLPYKEIVQSFGSASFMGAGEISMYLYGIYQGMVLTVFNMVPAVMASLGVAGLPAMTASYSAKNLPRMQYQADKLFFITGGISVPAAVFVWFFRGEIVQFLFDTSAGQTQIAASLLLIISPFIVFSCFISAFNAVLNALGKPRAVFCILLAASAVRCTVSFLLCGISGINIKAFAVSGGVFYTIIFVMSIFAVAKNGIKFSFATALMMPVAASVAAMMFLKIFASVALDSMPAAINLIFSGVIYCLLYLSVMMIWSFVVDIGSKK